MAADDADVILEKWLAAGQQILSGRKTEKERDALEERMAALEARFAEQPAEERRDALAELDADERELILAHRASKLAPPGPEGGEGEGGADEAVEPERKVRPGRRSGKAYHWTVDEKGRVQKVDIPHVYSGPDEPDEVELPAEDEEETAAA